MSARVLIVRLGALGDIVLALPAVEALKRARPEWRLSWLVEARHRAILEHHPAIDELITFDSYAWRLRWHSPGTWREIAATVRGLRARRFDLAFDLQGLFKSAAWTWLAGAHKARGLPGPAWREPLAHLFVRPAAVQAPRHGSDLAWSAIAATLDLAPGELAPPHIALTPEERAAMDARLAASGLRDFVVLNPGGGWVTKLWPLARFERLGRALLAATPLAIFVAVGPGEEAMARTLLASWSSPRAVCFATSVREYAALVARARLFVGSDTGPYHIARAMGTATLGLFGPTDPERNGPRFGEGEVLWGKVKCSPCYLRTCPTHIECMDALAPEAVIDAVRAVLGRAEELPPLG